MSVKTIQVAAHHEFDYRVMADFSAGKLACVAAIAQHDDSVRKFRYFAKPVRNVDDVSVKVKLEVGSSIIRMRAFKESALAISTICCCAMERFFRGVRLERFMPNRLR